MSERYDQAGRLAAQWWPLTWTRPIAGPAPAGISIPLGVVLDVVAPTEMWDATGHSVIGQAPEGSGTTELRQIDTQWYQTDLTHGADPRVTMFRNGGVKMGGIENLLKIP